MRYPIIIHPDERLNKKAEPIEYITDEIVNLLDNMYETMVAHDGIGLAAPQIGKNLRLAVVEVEEGDRFDFINPEIIEHKGTNIDVEGCLSIPDYDREGSEMEVTAYGYLARAFQHEIDHLDGKLFINQVIEVIKPEDLERYMEEHVND